MNIFEALTVNDAFSAALATESPIVGEEHEASPESYREIWNVAAAEIADVYEEGTGAFISERCPDLHAQLNLVREIMEDAWGNDLEAFRAAVGQWKDLLLEGASLFEKHRDSHGS